MLKLKCHRLPKGQRQAAKSTQMHDMVNSFPPSHLEIRKTLVRRHGLLHGRMPLVWFQSLIVAFRQSLIELSVWIS